MVDITCPIDAALRRWDIEMRLLAHRRWLATAFRNFDQLMRELVERRQLADARRIWRDRQEKGERTNALSF